jgi:4-amino-4-deoxy-L-arabinose transferase-like glycosyltransferase
MALADRFSGAQMMLGLVLLFTAGLLWQERKDNERFVYLMIGLGLGCAIGHLAGQ